MIRANLLPRPKERLTAFGAEFELRYIREAVAGISIVVAVALIGTSVESLRLHRITTAAEIAEAYLSAQAPARERARRLALDVARFQEIAREEERVRRSGTIAAIEIARIGNAIPGRVWLDSIEHDTDGFQLAGESTAIGDVGGTIVSLTKSFPQSEASVVHIENRQSTDRALHFTARLGTP